MQRIFGKKKEKAPPPSIDETTGRLTARGDTLDEKINKLDQELLKHKEMIKKARPGPAQESAKRRAINVLKQKRMYENQRDQLYQQQFSIESVAFTAQQAKDSVETVQALKQATKDVKQALGHKELDISKIDELNDEMADLMDINQDIQEALARSYDVPDDIDENELMGELDALDAELALEAETGGANEVPSYLQESLPDAPEQKANQEDQFGLPVAQKL
eukprot:TRINITY_DN42200_c0_g1_i6.p2 TRINITY_DN42200_c0_g1~~TRINITY_DN42200_c0_g1_i6.p2  ORF type:complete len:220 (-),score=57.39 TRINITY_DN42200_c0_g1_i6:285-944(-)